MGLLLRCNLESWEVKRRRETHDQDTFGPSHYEKPPACKKGRVGRKSYQNKSKQPLSSLPIFVLHKQDSDDRETFFVNDKQIGA